MDLTAYRAAVDELLIELAGFAGPDDVHKAELTLVRWTATAELAAVLDATPLGATATVSRLLAEVRGFQPDGTGTSGPGGTGACGRGAGACDLTCLVRTRLLTQIDAVWWGGGPAYRTDGEVRASAELVDLEPLRRQGHLLFRYRRRPVGWPARWGRSLHRRLWTDRTPPGPGLRHARARPEMVAMLNHLAVGYPRLAPPDSPPLWLAGLISPAVPPDAHGTGYAVDLELGWLRRYGADGALAQVLRDGQRYGELNVVDEGWTWHVCLSPTAVADLRAAGARPGG